VLTNLPRKEEKPKVKVRKVISLEEMIDRLHARIEKQMKLTFSELLEDSKEKAHVIVGFLAILESVKQGSILVAQARRFDDIEIEKESVSAPKYY
jgi:segregation and condensation protein A